MSPSRVVLAITMRARPDQTSPSGTTSETLSVTAGIRSGRGAPCWSLALQFGRLALDVLDAAAHEERLLGNVVVLALDQRLERGDRLGQRHEHAGLAGELLGHEHR